MKKLGITEGDWFCYRKTEQHRIEEILTKNRLSICAMPIFQEESDANAKLIADAGTTANKCGLLPSELLEQRDEMLIFMKTVSNKKMFHQGDFKDMKELILKITKP